MDENSRPTENTGSTKKVVIVYDPLDNKAREDTYSYIYKGMLNALFDKLNPKAVIKDCHAEEIDADVIIFWDVNSCHHIKIEGIEKHPALKMEYMSDPYQSESKGVYIRYNMPVHKLNAEQRLKRALERGVSKIIMSNKAGYYKYFYPILKEDNLLFFPHAPWFKSGEQRLTERNQKVLAQGSVGLGIGYDFRYWAFQRPNVTFVKHNIQDRSMPCGKDYGEFLKQWAGALALDDYYPVPKYYEMPHAGCVTFMQYFDECKELGFRDYETCVYVNQKNFDERIEDFINDIPSYQKIADRGIKLMENYTAQKFADFIERNI